MCASCYRCCCIVSFADIEAPPQATPSHTHSHSAHRYGLPSPSSIFLRSLSGGCCPRSCGLLLGQTPERWTFALGRDCGNGGVFPRRPRLPRLPPPLPEQRNAVWCAWAVVCVCELWHPPLRECGDGSMRNKAGLG